MRRLLTRLRAEDGFTLTELLVVMPLLAIMLAAVTGMVIVLMSGNSQTTGQLTQQETFFPTLDNMMADLRTAMPPGLGGSALLSATSSAISFYSPDRIYSLSGTTSPFHLREVAYQFSGGALQRQSVTSTNTYTTIVSTTPWGTWTSASGNFPLSTFPSSSKWTTLLGTGLGGAPAIVSASFTYYDGNGNTISAPVSAANLGLVRTIQVTVTGASGGAPSKQTSYSNTATIRETQPTS
jgi:prepilin-type N-terminal cleavage/methylation domain-containing protein